jgi:hypothetical protein
VPRVAANGTCSLIVGLVATSRDMLTFYVQLILAPGPGSAHRQTGRGAPAGLPGHLARRAILCRTQPEIMVTRDLASREDCYQSGPTII